MTGTESQRQGEQAPTEDLRPVYTPEVIIKETEMEVDIHVAKLVIDQVNEKPESVLINPTGNTQTSWYDIAAMASEKYWPLEQDHPNSYYTYMMKHFMSRVEVGAWHIPNSSASDPAKESDRYQKILDQHQPADLAILGIGPKITCHIGFNERGSAFDSRVRYVEQLDPETVAVNATLFDSPAEMPSGAITQGIADIMSAKRILLVAKGKDKVLGISRALTGPISSDCPASFLRYHPNVTIVLDSAAAMHLPKKK
jgi:glucosamine-6-phosphate deaminase